MLCNGGDDECGGNLMVGRCNVVRSNGGGFMQREGMVVAKMIMRIIMARIELMLVCHTRRQEGGETIT